MVGVTVTKARIRNGIWEGVVRGSSGEPKLDVLHLGEKIRSFTLTDSGDGSWQLRIAIPPDRLSDGIQVFQITDAESGDMLDQFVIATGEAVDGDLHAEVALLRAELDLLKRAVRRLALEEDAQG